MILGYERHELAVCTWREELIDDVPIAETQISAESQQLGLS